MGSVSDLNSFKDLNVGGERAKMPGEFESSPAKGRAISTTLLSSISKTYTGPTIDIMEAIKKNLGEEVEDYVHTNHDLLTFVAAVFGLPRETGERILGHSFSLHKSGLKKYNAATHETQMHKPFIKIAKKLLQDAVKCVGLKPKERIMDGYWDGNGNKAVIQEGRVRKPDLLNFWEPVPKGIEKADRPTWSTVKHIVEFKRNPTAGKRKFRPATSRSIASCPPTIMEDIVKGRGKRLRSPSDDEEEEQEEEEEEYEDEDEEKSEDSQESEDQALQTNSNKRARVDETLFDGEVQLACYAVEALAATNRYWVPGVLIDKAIVTACYFDRHLVVCTEAFSFHSNPEKLALMLYALHRCQTPAQIGFDRHLRPWSSHVEGEITPKMKAALDRPVKTPVGAFLEYSVTELEEVAEGEEATAPLSLRVDKVIRRPDDLISRGTMVYKVARRLDSGSYSIEHYAFKLSAQLVKRKSEFSIVKAIKERVPQVAHDHFPRFLLSTVLTVEDLDLPWRGMSLNLHEGNHQERVFRGILGALYVKLWEAGDVKNFKQVFLDCVEGHHLAWYTGGALHRDVNENNVMVLKDGIGSVKGVLNDWDTAKFYDDKDDMLNVAHHRTCSPPFMAIELLVDMSSVYYYRFDLESFFWLLVWAAVHYDLEKGTRQASVVSALATMTLGSDENISRKLTLLTEGEMGRHLFNKAIKPHLKPGFEEIYTEWIIPLRDFFAKGRSQFESEEGGDNETLGGRVTFKKFMKVLTKKDDGYRTWGIPQFLEGKE